MDNWASSDVPMGALAQVKCGECIRRIEEYYRGIKPFCGVERCQTRRAKAQRNHIGLSIPAFLRLECHRFALGIS